MNRLCFERMSEVRETKKINVVQYYVSGLLQDMYERLSEV
jgi:hypothetical protein